MAITKRFASENYVADSVDNIVKGDTPVAQATNAEKATQDASGNVITSTYETKSDATAKLTEAKNYATQIKNELLNGAGDAYDTLKELGDLIDDKQDAITALETIAAGKADKSELFSKDYNDLTNKPTIPSIEGLASEIYVEQQIANKADQSELFSKDYNDLTNKPTIPSIDGLASETYVDIQISNNKYNHPANHPAAIITTTDDKQFVSQTEKDNWNLGFTHAQTTIHAPSNAQKIAI